MAARWRALAVAALVAACGSDDEDASTLAPGSEPAGTGGTAAQAPGDPRDPASGAGGTATPGEMENPTDIAGMGNGGGSGAPVGEVEPSPGEYGARTQLLAPNSEMAVAELNAKIY